MIVCRTGFRTNSAREMLKYTGDVSLRLWSEISRDTERREMDDQHKYVYGHAAISLQ